MPTCPQCGTTEPDGAQWCGKCYLPFAPTPSAAGVREVALPGAAAPSPSPVVPPPMPPPPPTPVVMVPPPAAPVMAPPAQPLGWDPPAGAPSWMPAPAAASGPAAEIDDGRLFSGRAIALVATCIGLGILMQFFAYEISHDSSRNVDSQIRWDIVLTVLQYAVVAGIVLSQITTKIKLRWGPGPPVARVAIGAAVGLGGGGLILLALHASTGRLTSDSRVVLLMSGGEMTRIIAATVLTCVAAPLVEEVLFRGLLLESLRRHHAAMALIVSAMFFAVWHLNRQGLIYYTAMGCIFGGLYIKRGLVASMTAHFCFNGALTVAAIYLVLGPSHTYTVDSLKVTVAAGWTDETPQTSGYFNSGSALYLQGPDASVIAVMALTGGPLAGQGFDADTFTQRLSSTPVQLPGGTYDANSVHEIDLPTVGTAVEINFSLNDYTAYKGEYVFFGANNETYMAMLVNGGSPKADTDFTTMLNSLEPAGPTGLPVS